MSYMLNADNNNIYNFVLTNCIVRNGYYKKYIIKFIIFLFRNVVIIKFCINLENNKSYNSIIILKLNIN